MTGDKLIVREVVLSSHDGVRTVGRFYDTEGIAELRVTYPGTETKFRDHSQHSVTKSTPCSSLNLSEIRALAEAAGVLREAQRKAWNAGFAQAVAGGPQLPNPYAKGGE